MKEPKVLPGDRVFVAFPQKSNVVRIVKLVKANRVATELLIELLYGACILGAPVHQFVLPVAFYLGGQIRSGHHRSHGDQRHHKHQDDKDVSFRAIAPPWPPFKLTEKHKTAA